MQTMHVQEKHYKILKSGEKTIELRLFDEKRKAIREGDMIKFYSASDENDSFLATIISLHKAENFESLCNIINPLKAGFESKETLTKTMEEFYPLSKQNELGVIGIEICKNN